MVEKIPNKLKAVNYRIGKICGNTPWYKNTLLYLQKPGRKQNMKARNLRVNRAFR